MTNQNNNQDHQALQVEAPTFLAEWNKSEIEQQITTAKKFPRDLDVSTKRAIELATTDEVTARECMYALQRGTGSEAKRIEGGSIRLAEIWAHCYGNCRVGARLVDVGLKTVTAQGIFFDLETNTIITKEVERRITYKNGHRYNDDMIGMTGNAASAIAFRNALFSGIPKPIWWPVYTEARLMAIGKADTLLDRRQKMFEYFKKLGMTETQVLELMGADTPDEIGLDEIFHLGGLANAIKDGEHTIDELLGPDGQAIAGRKMSESEHGDGRKQRQPKNGDK